MAASPNRAARPSRPVGRPREFDTNDALADALEVFLNRGYLNASMADLTEAMGISRPSVYAAFDSKEELFKRALAMHAGSYCEHLQQVLAEPAMLTAAWRLLDDAAFGNRHLGGLGGYMAFLVSLPQDRELEPVRAEIMRHRNRMLEAVAERFGKAQTEGQISLSTPPGTLAFLMESLAHGLSERARADTPRSELDRLMRSALWALEHAGVASPTDPKAAECGELPASSA